MERGTGGREDRKRGKEKREKQGGWKQGGSEYRKGRERRTENKIRNIYENLRIVDVFEWEVEGGENAAVM